MFQKSQQANARFVEKMHDAMQHLLLMLCDAVVELDSDTRLKGKSKQPLKFIAKFPRFFLVKRLMEKNNSLICSMYGIFTYIYYKFR